MSGASVSIFDQAYLAKFVTARFATGSFPPSTVRWWKGDAAPRTEVDLDSAASAIVDHQAEASVHFGYECVRAVCSVRVHRARMCKVAGHPIAAVGRVEHSSYAPDHTRTAMFVVHHVQTYPTSTLTGLPRESGSHPA